MSRLVRACFFVVHLRHLRLGRKKQRGLPGEQSGRVSLRGNELHGQGFFTGDVEFEVGGVRAEGRTPSVPPTALSNGLKRRDQTKADSTF